MELSIQKYCTLTPRNVTLNGQKLVEIDVQDSLEKSLIQTYRLLGLNYLKFFKMDNLSKLALLASESILKDTGLYEISDKKDMAVVLVNASSSLVADANYQQTINDPENYFPSPSLFVYTLPNITIGEICIKYKIYGENVFLISQKFDADILYFYVNELFKNTDTQHCITGWVECNETTHEALLFLIEKGTSSSKFDINTIDNLYKTKYK
jgi:hypothetical protein